MEEDPDINLSGENEQEVREEEEVELDPDTMMPIHKGKEEEEEEESYQLISALSVIPANAGMTECGGMNAMKATATCLPIYLLF